MKVSAKLFGLKTIIGILTLFDSCSTGGNVINYKPVIYEYNIAKKSYSVMKTMQISSNSPFFTYFHNDNNKIILSQYGNLYIINTLNKKEEVINLDSLMMHDCYFSLSPTENKVVFAGFSTDLTIVRNGLYLLDLDTKSIRILKSNNDKELPETYSFPVFSNNGKLITYQQFNTGYRDSIRDYFHPARSIYTIDLETNRDNKIFSSEDFGVQYSMFDNTDKNLIIIGFPKNLIRINLSSSLIDTIDNSHYFSSGVYLQGYPHLLFNESKILFACENMNITTSEHQILEYNNETKKSAFFSNGIMPMSINSSNNNLIIRSNCYYTDKISSIEILSSNGNKIEYLKQGERAIFSPNGDKILLLTSEIASDDDY